ncbi:hypothetical protein Cgig2_014224 [Carnegiea gigantea]|uniref:Peptidase A1 domain-containing protein n=1 Tax=Carnegiea gigantea TaxID=171969 RepID=A0A9Q1K0G0_9CARY|nr:hypothetical protein Cgig2_014224 [Carnegiea gigantea]
MAVVTVQLGTPVQEFHCVIDTGSDELWISCSKCDGYPQTTEIQVFSAIAALLSYYNKRCSAGAELRNAFYDSSSECAYRFQCGDGSGTQRYYVSDVLHLKTVFRGTPTYNNSANIILGLNFLIKILLIPTTEMFGPIFTSSNNFLAIQELVDHHLLDFVVRLMMALVKY